MKEEKTKESKKEITVLDEGIDFNDIIIDSLVCCWGALSALRG